MKLIAQSGGVIGANAFPSFYPKGFDTTVSDYVDAIDDLVEGVGINHVGLGTDYTQDQPKDFLDWLSSQQGTKRLPNLPVFPDPALHPIGMATPDKLSSVARRLASRGYDPESITKLLGGNWLRLFQRCLG